MNIAEFSEFTFALSISIELMHRFYGAPSHHIWSARLPFVPNLREEVFLGFDTMFDIPTSGIPLALQYKLSSRNRRLPRGVSLGSPSYRFDVNAKQHAALVQLMTQIRMNVFYCSPVFTRVIDLQNFLITQSLANHSAFVIPPPLPAPSTKSHKIYFDSGRVGYLCSTPTKVDIFDFKNMLLQDVEVQDTAMTIYTIARGLAEMGISVPAILHSDDSDLWRSFVALSVDDVTRLSIRYTLLKTILLVNFGIDFFIDRRDSLPEMDNAAPLESYWSLFSRSGLS